MYGHIQERGFCPHFTLQQTEHSLSREYYNGITPGFKEIMTERLRGNE